RGPRLAFVFVTAHEHERVAAARICDGDAGIPRRAETGRNTGYDLEAHPLFVEKQRFGAASIEDEGVAPFQPRDGLALAGLLGEQVADRFLFQRLRGRSADVDPFRVRSRM